MKWYIHLDWDNPNDYLDEPNYTITTNPDKRGWCTDMGSKGYGLHKEIAQWICDKLNECGEEPPYIVNEYGFWEKNTDISE